MFDFTKPIWYNLFSLKNIWGLTRSLAAIVRLFLCLSVVWKLTDTFYFTSIFFRCKPLISCGPLPTPDQRWTLDPASEKQGSSVCFSNGFHNLAQRQRRARYVFDFPPWRFAWSSCFFRLCRRKEIYFNPYKFLMFWLLYFNALNNKFTDSLSILFFSQ